MITTPTLFTINQTGMVGQEIISPNGNVVAWTIDPVMGQLICQFLNEHFSDSSPALWDEGGGK